MGFHYSKNTIDLLDDKLLNLLIDIASI